ncbi:MAG: hypothetical protein J6V98_08075 [Bacteroidales bacterium]|nr:hypothetical protein [Bacteroidales bacterium]
MGLIPRGITGPVIGKVGPAVGYLWKGKPCLRAYREHINFPNTEEQLRQRSWFVGMVRFAAQATPVLRLGMRRQANEAKMTEGNLFILWNKRHFQLIDGALDIDYAHLKLTAGSAADVYFHAPQFKENEVLEVDFEKNTLSLRASGDDNVYLYVYAPRRGMGYLSAPTARRNKSLSMRLPEAWSGEEVHLYGFVVDREGRSSNSTYIGVGRVNHYEDRGRYIPLNKNWKDFVDIANEANNPEAPAEAVGKEQETLEKPTIDLFGDPPEVP